MQTLTTMLTPLSHPLCSSPGWTYFSPPFLFLELYLQRDPQHFTWLSFLSSPSLIPFFPSVLAHSTFSVHYYFHSYHSHYLYLSRTLLNHSHTSWHQIPSYSLYHTSNTPTLPQAMFHSLHLSFHLFLGHIATDLAMRDYLGVFCYTGRASVWCYLIHCYVQADM